MRRLYAAQHWIATLLGVVLLAGTVVPVVQSACALAKDLAAKHNASPAVHHDVHDASPTSTEKAGAHCIDSASDESAPPSSSSSPHAPSLPAPEGDDCHGVCLVQCCSAESQSSTRLSDVYLPGSFSNWTELLAPVLQSIPISVQSTAERPPPRPEDHASLVSPVRLHVWTATFLK